MGSISERYISNEQLEAWVEKRFGPNSPFNRQLARDLLDWGVTEGLKGFLDTPFEQLPSEVLDEDPRYFAERLETRR